MAKRPITDIEYQILADAITQCDSSNIDGIDGIKVPVGDRDVPIGGAKMRVKAIGGNPPSAWLSNTVAFTVESLDYELVQPIASTIGDEDQQLIFESIDEITPVTYTSSNPTVATIVSGNMLHVVSLGTSTITAIQGDISRSKTFTVYETIGDIYNVDNWTDLNDFDQERQGQSGNPDPAAFTISAGKISTYAEGGNTSFLFLKRDNTLARVSFYYRSKRNNDTSSNPGNQFTLNSAYYGSTVTPFYIAGVYINGSNMVLYNNSGMSQDLTVESPFQVSDDIVESTLERDFLKWKSNFKNVTQNKSYDLEDNSSAINSFRGIINNNAYINEIDNIILSSKEAKSYPRWCMGDSISSVGITSPIQLGYSFRIDARTYSGGGNKSGDLLRTLPFFIENITPSKVFILIGTNDGNVPSYYTNLDEVVSTLEDAGWIVVVLCPPPRNGVDMSPLNNYIKANYPDQYISMFDLLKDPSSNDWNPIYYADGVHPNELGHKVMAQNIKSSPLY